MSKGLFKKISIAVSFTVSLVIAASAQKLPVNPGPYQPTEGSFKQYQYPE
jgi:hypothetical protein